MFYNSYSNTYALFNQGNTLRLYNEYNNNYFFYFLHLLILTLLTNRKLILLCLFSSLFQWCVPFNFSSSFFSFCILLLPFCIHCWVCIFCSRLFCIGCGVRNHSARIRNLQQGRGSGSLTNSIINLKLIFK